VIVRQSFGGEKRQMPPLVTTNATILCSHGGRVTLVPRQTAVMAGGAPVLCEPDLVGAPIVGCPQISATTKPCTTVVSTIPGASTSPRVQVQGRPAYVATLNGVTDGVPPGTLTVVNPGQTTVQG